MQFEVLSQRLEKYCLTSTMESSMLQLFGVLFLQEYQLQDTWFIFNLAGSNSESRLLKAPLVGESLNICSLIKKIKGICRSLALGFSGMLYCYMPGRIYFRGGGDGDIFWSRERTEPAVSQSRAESCCSDRVPYCR